MKTSGYRKTIACIIVVLLLIEMSFGTSASLLCVYAEEEPANHNNTQAEQANISIDNEQEEGVLEKGEDYTVFSGDTGERTIEMYPSPVRFEDENGRLHDIDNSLIEDEEDPDIFTNACGAAEVRLPKEPSEEMPIEVSYNNKVFSFFPLIDPPLTESEEGDSNEVWEDASQNEQDEQYDGDEEATVEEDEVIDPSYEEDAYEDDRDVAEADDEAVESEDEFYEDEESAEDYDAEITDNSMSAESETVDTDNEEATDSTGVEQVEMDGPIEEPVEDIYHNEEVRTVGLSYNTPDPAVTLQYYATDSGVKEDIILNKIPSTNEFSFIINCQGTIPELKYRGILFMDEETGEETGSIQEPYMTDSSDAEDLGYSEDLQYYLDPIDVDNGVYRVDLVVSWDYLEDPDRVFPVIIDPTYSANTTSAIKSSYVLSKHNTTNYYSSSIRKMCIGYGANEGIARSYIQFPALKNKINGNYVTSASLKLTEKENSVRTRFGIYRVSGSWSNSSITYKNQPSFNSNKVASGQLKGTSNAKQTLNITSLARGWAKGTYASNGILIKADKETSSKKNFGSFHNANATSAGKRPVLSVTYTVPSPSVPAKPTSVLLNNKTPLYARNTDAVQVSWTGVNSNILDTVYWRFVRYTAENTYATAVNIQAYTSTGVKTPSGTFTVPASKLAGLSDGKYAIAVRGVDKMGKNGEGKICYLYLDGTPPVLSNVQMSHVSTFANPSECLTPTISWTASDTRSLGSVNVTIDGTTVYSSAQSGNGSYTFDEDDFTGTTNHLIRLIAIDKAGNTTESSPIYYYTNLDSPVISDVSIEPETGNTEFSNNRQPKITFTVDSANLDNCEVTLGENVIYTSDETGVHTVNVPSNAGLTDGQNVFVITAESTTGITSSRQLRYYYDGTAPVINSLTTNPTTGILNRSNNPSPEICWNLSELSFKEISYSMDGENYIPMGTDPVGSFVLPSGTLPNTGRYVIHIKAEDNAGNVSEQSIVYYLSLGTETDEDYVPEITEVREYYGKRVILYSAEINDDTIAYWNLYRRNVIEEGGSGTSVEELVQGHVSGNMFIDKEILPEGTYAYRMEAVFTDTNKGTITGNSFEYTNEIPVEAFSNTTGSKDYLGRFSFSTPNGSGYVGAGGVLTYTQQDYDLNNDKLSYGLSRTYDSKSVITGMLGKGWRDSYHQEIYTCGDDIYYARGDGSCYKFERSGNDYVCEDSNDFTLVVGTDEYTITDKYNTEYIFNNLGQLTRITDANGYNVYFYYDQYGRMSRVTSKEGMSGQRSLEFEYYDDDIFQLEQIILPDETRMEYATEGGFLTKASHVGRGLLAMHTDYCYAYDEEKMSSILDAESNEYGISYSDDKVAEIAYPDGTKDEYAYSDNTAERTYLTESGDTIYSESSTVDSSGREISRTGKDGSTNTTVYSQQQDWLPSAEQYTAAYETIGNNGEIIFHEDSNAETEYTYNSNGDVTREEDDTSVTTYTYGDSNNESLVTEEITTENNEITEHVTFSYDEDGNTLSEEDLIEDSLIETTYIDGNADTETETEEGVVTSETDYDYDEEGNVIEEETESGVVEESIVSEYDSMGRVISEDDGDTVTTYTYDYMGRVTHSETTTRGISGTTSTSKEYNDNGTLVSETDERGAVTTFTYDSMNRCLSSTKEGNTTSHTYGYSTNVSVNTGAVNTSYDILSREITTDTFGHTVSDVYTDSAGKIVKKTESGVTHEYLYDKSGNQVVERLSASGEDPQINMTLYDRNGRSTHEIINPEVSGNSFVITSDSIATESVYSDRDEVIETINAMGDSMYYTYDDAGRTTGIGSTSSASDRTIQYSEDGLTTTITDAGGKTQTEVKDESGLTLSMTDSADGCSPITETYSYDSDGNMTKKIMSDGSEIWYEYDALGRNTLEQRFEKIGSALHQTSEVCYTFNIHGDLTKTECYSFSGAIRTLYYKDEFTYDNLGRKVSEIVTNGNEAVQTTTWTYDAKGRVTDIDYPAIADISSVTYEYDTYDRLVSVSTGGNSPDRVITYDGYGRPLTVTDSSGQSADITAYSYDDYGRVTGVQHRRGSSALLSYYYTYDKDNKITSRHEVNNINGIEKDETRNYTYGGYGRLTQSQTATTRNGQTTNTYCTYTYDAAGNRTSLTDNDGTTTFTFNGLNQLTRSQRGSNVISYDYDANGNMESEIEDEGQRQTYYEFTPEGTMSTISTQGTADSYYVEMKYDANGTRVRRTGDDSGQFYYIDGQLITDKKTTGSSLTYLYAGSEVIGAYSGNDHYDYLQDIQESTAAILENDGTPAAAYTYTDFGETTESIANSIGNEICYTGSVYDKATGDYYLNARYYDPSAGVFLSQDTYRGGEEDSLQWDLYSYCANDPIAHVDIDGHKVFILKSKLKLKIEVGDITIKTPYKVGHMAIIYQDSEGNWKYFSWNQDGFTTQENMNKNICRSVDDKYIHGTTLDKKINDYLERPKKRRYKRYICLTSQRYKAAEEYFHEMMDQGVEYDALTYNCGWVVIRALYQGEWGKKKRKLYNMLWANKYGCVQFRTVIPQKAFPRLAKIYKKKRKHL